jgi:hypothetical protein
MITSFNLSQQSLETGMKGAVRPFIARLESGPLRGPSLVFGRALITICNSRALSYSAANSAGAEGPG